MKKSIILGMLLCISFSVCLGQASYIHVKDPEINLRSYVPKINPFKQNRITVVKSQLMTVKAYDCTKEKIVELKLNIKVWSDKTVTTEIIAKKEDKEWIVVKGIVYSVEQLIENVDEESKGYKTLLELSDVCTHIGFIGESSYLI